MAKQLGLFKRLATIDSILSRSQKPAPRRHHKKPTLRRALATRHFLAEAQVTLPFPKKLYQYRNQSLISTQEALSNGINLQEIIAARDTGAINHLTYKELRDYIEWLNDIDSKDRNTIEKERHRPIQIPRLRNPDGTADYPKINQIAGNLPRTIDWPIVEWHKRFSARPPRYYLPWQISYSNVEFSYPHVTYLEHPHFFQNTDGIHFHIPENEETDAPSHEISISAHTTWDELNDIENAFMNSDLVSVVKCSTRLGVTKRIFIRVPSGEMKEVFRIHKRWPGHPDLDHQSHSNINAPFFEFELLDPNELSCMTWSFTQNHTPSQFWQSDFNTQSPELNLYQSYGVTYSPKNTTLHLQNIDLAKLVKDKETFMRLFGKLVGRSNPKWKQWKNFKKELKKLESLENLTNNDYTRFVFKKDGIEFDIIYGPSGLKVAITVNGLLCDFLFHGNQLVEFDGFQYLDPCTYPALWVPERNQVGHRKIKIGRHELVIKSHRTPEGVDLEDLLIGELYANNRVAQAEVRSDFTIKFGDVDELPQKPQLESIPNGIALLFGMNWGWSTDPKDADLDDTLAVSKFTTMNLASARLGVARHIGLAELNLQFQLSPTDSTEQESLYPKNYISLERYGLDIDFIPGRELKRPHQDHSPKTLTQFVDFLNELCEESPNIVYQVIINDDDELSIEMFLFDEEHEKWTYASTFSFDANGSLYGAYQDIYKAKTLMSEDNHRYFDIQGSRMHPDTLDDIHFSFVHNRRYQDQRQTRTFIQHTFMPFWNKLCEDSGATGFFGSISGENLLLYQSEFVVFHYTPQVLPLMLKVIQEPHKLTWDDIKTIQNHFITTAYGSPLYIDDIEDDPNFNPYISILPHNQKARAVTLAENLRLQLGNHKEGFAVIIDMSHVYHEPPTDPDDSDENSEDEDSSDDASDSTGLQVTPTQSLPAA